MASTLKGALIAFTPSLIGATPDVVVFQFNPETITHSWTPAEAAAPGQSGQNPLAVKGVPGETFTFTLAVDANEMIADGNAVSAALAGASGVYPRLSALEMLLYPTGASGVAGLVGSVSASIGASGINVQAGRSAAGQNQNVPQSQVPIVLFVWGPQRIVPVRVTALTITERIYDGLLNPIHAEAQIMLRVLTPQELQKGIQGPMKQIAQIAYAYTQGLRQAHAAANLGDAAASIIGMLPAPF
jgi:hypothetical protein